MSNTIGIVVFVILIVIAIVFMLYKKSKNESKQQQILGKIFGMKEKFYYFDEFATSGLLSPDRTEEEVFVDHFGKIKLYCPVSDKDIILQQFRLADETIKLLNDPEFQKCLDNLKLKKEGTDETYSGKELIVNNINELTKIYNQLKEYGIPSKEEDLNTQYYNVSLLYMLFAEVFQYIGIALAGMRVICNKELLDTFYVLLFAINNQIFYLIKRDLKQPVITYDKDKNIIMMDTEKIKEITGKDINTFPKEGTPEDYSKAYEKDIFQRWRQDGTISSDGYLVTQLRQLKLWNKHPEILQKQFKVTPTGYDCSLEFRN
jgi:hypothetical protein